MSLDSVVENALNPQHSAVEAATPNASGDITFESLHLHPQILRALADVGYTHPTPIQAQAIPQVLAGGDIMASAQTGTGKTAAFTLPALNLLAEPHPNKSRGPRILVLTPTRELAAQVNEAARKYGKYVRARCVSIVGGMPYPLQNKLLSQPLDILVATPGRFIDHMESGRIDLSRLQMLVLDEADRMLDMGFMPDVERICAALPAERQTLLFSATLDGIKHIGEQFLRKPTTIQVAGQKEKHANIEQRLHFVDDMNHKNKLLEHLLIDPEVNQAIIFTSTKRHADVLADDLYAAGHRTAALHGDMNQGARNRTLTKLRHGDIKVLIATDVAARGIDVKGISHVINYDLPKFAEDYVHRIGRTGRANSSGVAISFASRAERFQLRKIEQYTGQRIEVSVIAGLEPKQAFNDDAPRGGRNRKPQGRSNNRPQGRPQHAAGKQDSFRAERPAAKKFGQNEGKEVNGNSIHYTKDTNFQFARELEKEGRKPARSGYKTDAKPGNRPANKANGKVNPKFNNKANAGKPSANKSGGEYFGKPRNANPRPASRDFS